METVSMRLSKERFGLIGGALLFVLILALPTPTSLSRPAQNLLAVTLLMAVWWITEPVPIAATALLPLALFPLLSVLPYHKTAPPYGNPNIFLFMGGFFIAMAMQRWGLHRRIALRIILAIGSDPSRMILGFMIATALLSMWISNTATTLMVFPIGLAIIGRYESSRSTSSFATSLMLAIAYAANIGGTATLIGTPPNLIMVGMYQEQFPHAPPIGFVRWMVLGVPFVLLFLPLIWVYLTRVAFSLKEQAPPHSPEVIREEVLRLGPLSKGERYTLMVALATALLWIFREPIQLGAITFPGWSLLFPDRSYLHDSTVAIFMAVLLFLIPVDRRAGVYLLNWEWASRVPWQILILFGGGFSLARAFQETGLSAWFGERLTLLQHIPAILMMLLVALLMTFLTEVTSNTATTTVMMPILAATASSLGVHPLLLMVPATFSASCAFMLPVATPPNAIVFASEKIRIFEMARVGFALNLLGAILVTALAYALSFLLPLYDPPIS